MSSPRGWGHARGTPRDPQWGAPQSVYGPPAPQRRSIRGLLIGLATGAGVVVLGVVVAVFVFHGARPGGDRSVLTKSWSVQKPDPDIGEKEIAAFPTMDEKTFVRVGADGATGYDMATGRARWTVPAPVVRKARTSVCAATHGVRGGVAAFLAGDSGCTTVVAFSVVTGKVLWTATPPVAHRSDPPGSGALAVGQDRIYVTNVERLVSYDAKTGPDGKGPAKPVEVDSGHDCGFFGISAGTDRLASILDCGGGDAEYVVGLDPTTLRRTFRTRQELELGGYLAIVNVHPLVLHATNALDNGELRFFDDSGRQTKVLSSRQPQGTLDMSQFPFTSDDDDNLDISVRVVGTTLVSVLAPPDVKAERKVAGIDVRTGRWMWTKSLDTTRFVEMAFGDNPNKAAVFTEGGGAFGPVDRERPQIIDVDPANGTLTKGSSLDTGDDDPDLTYTATFAVEKRVVVVQSHRYDNEPLITAYG